MDRRSSNYRKSIGKYVGKEIVLECSNFEFGMVDDNGKLFMILKKPVIKKIAGRAVNGEWIVAHLWIRVPMEIVQYIDRYSPLARKIQISGRVHEYRYSETNELQAGVRASDVRIIKYRKDLAKKYNLSPGQQLSIERMDIIINREELKAGVIERLRSKKEAVK